MSKRATKKQNNEKAGMFRSMAEFFGNYRTQFVCGLILAFITMYMGCAIISFFFSGAADQSKIENVSLKELALERMGDMKVGREAVVQNWAGVRGAYLANLLVNRMFGIPSVMLLFFMGSVAARLMHVRGISILKRFLFSASWLLWGSVFLGFFFARPGFFLNPGGLHGQYIADVIVSNIGVPGMLLMLLGVFLIISILTSSRTLPFLLGLMRRPNFSFGFLRRPAADEDEDDEEPQEEAADVEPPMRRRPAPLITASAPPPEDAASPSEEFVISIAPDEETYVPEPPAFQDEAAAEEIGEDDFVPELDLEDYDPKLDLSAYRNPTLDLLQKYESPDKQVDFDEQIANQRRIKQTLENFGISIASIKATVGPTITLYEVVPDVGVRIAKIKNLEDDIALNLEALGIRIIAPMPGKGTIGIEVPNKDPQIVSMQSIISSRKYVECKYDLPVALGKTITNEIFMFDLCKMPHLLVAGATGQGKSVGLNALITSLLYKKHPAELKFVLVDPKMVEFNIYGRIEKHYLAKLPEGDKAIITDPSKVIQTLNSLCKEMDDRYDLLMQAHVRDIKQYNDKFIHRRLNPLKGHRYMPYIVVIIDEFGDLIMTSGKEIELPIARIAQKARAVGLHMVIATQRPSTNIITGTIKANFPARLAFRVSSMIDSRTILDQPGANRLIGRGDMLFSQGNDLIRVQCAFVDTPEVESISEYIGRQTGYATAFELPEYALEGGGGGGDVSVDLSRKDPLFEEIARAVVVDQQGSTSFIQRKFNIGYNRAGRISDQLEATGIVGPTDGSKGRQVLIQDLVSLEYILKNLK
ncbi:MAG: DNA translocase FtsK [Tannerellaceae bacterium]|jgi:S-DNA-T family DNA segregation ATPase FtsK/SpoIIIE|nr:DNA translocase FtsK [Tannerellaceae bacterium]